MIDLTQILKNGNFGKMNNFFLVIIFISIITQTIGLIMVLKRNYCGDLFYLFVIFFCLTISLINFFLRFKTN